jgi:hypothetical protein
MLGWLSPDHTTGKKIRPFAYLHGLLCSGNEFPTMNIDDSITLSTQNALHEKLALAPLATIA